MRAASREPGDSNGFLVEHATLILRNYRLLTGRDLLQEVGDDDVARARQLYEAPFFVASHNAAPDPVLTYGNRTAQTLFEMSWSQFTGTPSRFTAEEPVREERERLLQRVAADGFIDDYSGVRISKTGRRFLIERATVWNLLDRDGEAVGQAATFSNWTPL